MICLNLGCGNKKFDGFVNVDINPVFSPDLLLDLEDASLPFADCSVDCIYSSHTLEHISPANYISLLKEMYRVSKDGTIWHIIVPFDCPSARCHPFHFRTYHYGSFDGFIEDKNDGKARGNVQKIVLERLNKNPNIIKRQICRLFPELQHELRFELKVKKVQE